MGITFDSYDEKIKEASQLPFMNDRLKRFGEIEEEISKTLDSHASKRDEASMLEGGTANKVLGWGLLVAAAGSVGAGSATNVLGGFLALLGGGLTAAVVALVTAQFGNIKEKDTKKYDEKHAEEVADLKQARNRTVAKMNFERERFHGMPLEEKVGVNGLEEILDRDPEIRSSLLQSFRRVVQNATYEEPRPKIDQFAPGKHDLAVPANVPV